MQWRSWNEARKMYLEDEFKMADFIELDDLFEQQTLYFPGRTLRIKCEGTLFSPFRQFAIPAEYKKRKFQTVSPISISLWKNEMEFCDIILISSDGKKTPAHKIILSSNF